MDYDMWSGETKDIEKDGCFDGNSTLEKSIINFIERNIEYLNKEVKDVELETALVEKSVENLEILRQLDRYMVGHSGFIAGGCFKNVLNKEKIKDVDIFFENEKEWNEAVKYYNSKTDGHKEDDNQVSETPAEYTFCYENDKVKAYVNKDTGVRVELCRSVFGTPKEVLSNFDFSVAKFAYYKDTNENDEVEYKVLCHKDFFEHLFFKRLVTDDKILFPMSTFERMIRYIGYGYRPCKETKMKISSAINSLSKEQIEVGKSLYDGMD